MSCVVGIAEKGDVYLCGDSIAVDSSGAVEVRRDPKVFERGHLIWGFAGCFRKGQLLCHALVVPKRKRYQDAHEYLVTSVVDAIRECFRVGGIPERDPNKDDETTNDEILVGFDGRLFRIEETCAVAESAPGFDAIGAGATAARGALYQQSLTIAEQRRSKREFAYSPERRLLDAMTVSERATNVVRKPFVTVKTGQPR